MIAKCFGAVFQAFCMERFPADSVANFIISINGISLRPQPQRVLPSFGSILPESQLQFLQRLQSCFLDDFFSSCSDEDEHDGFNVFGKLESHGSSYVHEQMHSGFTEFNASNRVKRYEDL